MPHHPLEDDQDQAIKVILDTKQYSSYEDVTKVLRHEGIGAAVTFVEKRYAYIDIPGTVKKMSIIAELLNLALIATHHWPSSVQVISLLSSYQTFASDSKITCSSITMSTLKALSLHRRAIEMQQVNKPDSALVFVKSAAKVAKQADEALGALAEKAATMHTLVEKALEAIMNDDAVSGKKPNIQDVIQQLQEKPSVATSTSKSGSQSKAETKASKGAERARSKEFALALVSVGLQNNAFESVRIFWSELQPIYRDLSNVEDQEAIKQAGDEKVNHAAEIAMEKVAENLNEIMCNLPTELEAKERFPALVAKLEQHIMHALQRELAAEK